MHGKIGYEREIMLLTHMEKEKDQESYKTNTHNLAKKN
jgi:hypothetical protein